MTNEPDFEITSSGQISKEFVSRNILTFRQAAAFIKQLAYKRNSDKNDPTTVFTDNCGTCSTKHALLKRLADENNFQDLKLVIGLYSMNPRNTPKIAATLHSYNMEYIPEAHCYLKYNNHTLDYTKKNSKPSDFMDDLIEETVILPEQIAEYKVNYHKDYLRAWLDHTNQSLITFKDLWAIREQCILDLTDY